MDLNLLHQLISRLLWSQVSILKSKLDLSLCHFVCLQIFLNMQTQFKIKQIYQYNTSRLSQWYDVQRINLPGQEGSSIMVKHSNKTLENRKLYLKKAAYLLFEE